MIQSASHRVRLGSGRWPWRTLRAWSRRCPRSVRARVKTDAGDAGHPARLGQITPIRCPGRRNRSNAPSGFPPAVRVRDFPPRAASAPLGDGPPAFNHRHSRSRDCRPDVLVVLDRRVRLRGQERGSSGVPSGTGKGRRRTLTRAAVTGTPAIRLTIPGLW